MSHRQSPSPVSEPSRPREGPASCGLGSTTRRACWAALARDLEACLVPLGFEAEKRAFTPHLTLARFKPPASIAGVLSEEPGVAESSFEVGHLALYRSHLHPKGARYEVLGTIPLGAHSKEE